MNTIVCWTMESMSKCVFTVARLSGPGTRPAKCQFWHFRCGRRRFILQMREVSSNRMRFQSLLFVALAVLAAACGEPSGPNASSSSHWLTCESDSDCDNLSVPASCGSDGYCVG